MLSSLLERLRNSAPPPGAPWPEIPDVPEFLWQHGTPAFWVKEYENIPTAAPSSYNTGGAFTGLSYTNLAWTMLGLMQQVLPTVKADGRKLWDALMVGLEWGRLLLDRVTVRLEPTMAPIDDFARIARWVGADPALLVLLPWPYRRRYVAAAKRLQRVRGTPAAAPIYQEILGASGGSITWSANPHQRDVMLDGSFDVTAAKQLVRRTMPPYLLIRMVINGVEEMI